MSDRLSRPHAIKHVIREQRGDITARGRGSGQGTFFDKKKIKIEGTLNYKNNDVHS